MAGLRDALRVIMEASAPRAGETNAVRMFAGPMARTADQEALSRAQQLAQSGSPREQIWNDTGWFQGVDGKWRFEIDDSGTRLGDEAVDRFYRQEADGSTRPVAGNASAILQHPKVFDAYPDISGRMTQIQRTDDPFTMRGDYSSDSGRIRLNAPDTATARSGLLHETQHAIQRQENFAIGGSPDEFTQQAEAELARDAMSWRRELAKWRREMPDADWIAVENRAVSEYQKMGAMDWLPSREARDIARDKLGNPDAQLEEIMRRYGTDAQVTPLRSKEVYERLAGEVEARNVQTRRNFTSEERRQRPPWTTQDISDEKQIVRYDPRASNALGDALRVSAGLGSLGLAGDFTLRQYLRDNMQGS